MKKFKLAILPIDENGAKLYDQFGWYCPTAPNHKVFEYSKAMIFEDKIIKGKGNVEDWISLIQEGHENDWIIKVKYIEE